MSRPVLLVMDVQPNIVERVASPDDYVSKVKQAVDAAHAAKIPVIYVVVGFREGFPEISPRNQSFSAIKNSDRAKGMVEPHPVIEPVGSDIVVTKRRISAFAGSDLEVILRSLEAEPVLTGIATSGVVLSTLREAADKDFKLTVLSDLCADSDEEVHRVLIEKVFPRQADVTTSAEWIETLAKYITAP